MPPTQPTACYNCQEHNTLCQRKPGMLICPTCNSFGWKCEWPKSTQPVQRVPQIQTAQRDPKIQEQRQQTTYRSDPTRSTASSPRGIHPDFFLRWPYAPTRPLVIPNEYRVPKMIHSELKNGDPAFLRRTADARKIISSGRLSAEKNSKAAQIGLEDDESEESDESGLGKEDEVGKTDKRRLQNGK